MLTRIVLYIAIGAAAFVVIMIIFIICMCRTMKKYMNGEYLADGKKEELLDKFDEEYGDEIDEETSLLISPLNHMEIIEEKPQVECFNAKTAQHRIKELGFESQFASNSRLKVTFELNKESRMIIGCIKTVEGLDFEDDETDPDEICFHVKMIPKRRKQKDVTKWKDPKSKILSLTFILGPFKKDINPRKKIRIRLYGRKKKFPYSSICYGETFMLVSKIAENDGIITRYKRIHPRTDNSIEDESPLVVTKDEDEDESFLDSLIPDNIQDAVESFLVSGSESDASDKEEEKLDKEEGKKEIVADEDPTQISANEDNNKDEVKDENDEKDQEMTKEVVVDSAQLETKSISNSPLGETTSSNKDTAILISISDNE